MKKFFRTRKSQILLYITFTACLLTLSGCFPPDVEDSVTVTTIATGLKAPIGLEIDTKGRVWVAEAGTGNNDGQVSAIFGGTKYDVITNFESVIAPEGEADGPSHLLFSDGVLYILGTGGKMYKVPESSLNPGSSTIEASSLEVEDIGAFVLSQTFEHPTGESHPYNLTMGDNKNIYITDAAANAIVRRMPNGDLSIVTEVPGIPNSTPVGPNPIESVPTGIYYNGHDFLVTTLLGFPFPVDQALIYKISPSGDVSTYQEGFTSLVDIAKGGPYGRIVLEHGEFGPTGFMPNTGRLAFANGSTITTLTDGLNLPAGMKQAAGYSNTLYVTSLGDNSVLKVVF